MRELQKFRFFGSWYKSAILYGVILALIISLVAYSYKGYPLEGAPQDGKEHAHIGEIGA
jgi:hypothetical protein